MVMRLVIVSASGGQSGGVSEVGGDPPPALHEDLGSGMSGIRVSVNWRTLDLGSNLFASSDTGKVFEFALDDPRERRVQVDDAWSKTSRPSFNLSYDTLYTRTYFQLPYMIWRLTHVFPPSSPSAFHPYEH